MLSTGRRITIIKKPDGSTVTYRHGSGKKRTEISYRSSTGKSYSSASQLRQAQYKIDAQKSKKAAEDRAVSQRKTREERVRLQAQRETEKKEMTAREIILAARSTDLVVRRGSSERAARPEEKQRYFSGLQPSVIAFDKKQKQDRIDAFERGLTAEQLLDYSRYVSDDTRVMVQKTPGDPYHFNIVQPDYFQKILLTAGEVPAIQQIERELAGEVITVAGSPKEQPILFRGAISDPYKDAPKPGEIFGVDPKHVVIPKGMHVRPYPTLKVARKPDSYLEGLSMAEEGFYKGDDPLTKAVYKYGVAERGVRKKVTDPLSEYLKIDKVKSDIKASWSRQPGYSEGTRGTFAFKTRQYLHEVQFSSFDYLRTRPVASGLYFGTGLIFGALAGVASVSVPTQATGAMRFVYGAARAAQTAFTLVGKGATVAFSGYAGYQLLTAPTWEASAQRAGTLITRGGLAYYGGVVGYRGVGAPVKSYIDTRRSERQLARFEKSIGREAYEPLETTYPHPRGQEGYIPRGEQFKLKPGLPSQSYGSRSSYSELSKYAYHLESGKLITGTYNRPSIFLHGASKAVDPSIQTSLTRPFKDLEFSSYKLESGRNVEVYSEVTRGSSWGKRGSASMFDFGNKFGRWLEQDPGAGSHYFKDSYNLFKPDVGGIISPGIKPDVGQFPFISPGIFIGERSLDRSLPDVAPDIKNIVRPDVGVMPRQVQAQAQAQAQTFEIVTEQLQQQKTTQRQRQITQTTPVTVQELTPFTPTVPVIPPIVVPDSPPPPPPPGMPPGFLLIPSIFEPKERKKRKKKGKGRRRLRSRLFEPLPFATPVELAVTEARIMGRARHPKITEESKGMARELIRGKRFTIPTYEMMKGGF